MSQLHLSRTLHMQPKLPEAYHPAIPFAEYLFAAGRHQTPWDITTATLVESIPAFGLFGSQVNGPRPGICLSQDGQRLYFSNRKELVQLALAAPFTLAGATELATSAALATPGDSYLHGVWVSANEQRLWYVYADNVAQQNQLVQCDLTTPAALGGGFSSSSLLMPTVWPQVAAPQLSPDGQHLFYTSGTGQWLRSRLNTPGTISGGFGTPDELIGNGDGTVTAAFAKPDGERAYGYVDATTPFFTERVFTTAFEPPLPPLRNLSTAPSGGHPVSAMWIDPSGQQLFLVRAFSANIERWQLGGVQ
ncbi:hypothetical protein [Spongiibacter sp. UBA1325]|uniref:hypothetical protein n=1 Tax=Spongiibacter sp. UBA1325 TaxID=1947543 RepID=UPI00257E4BFA|nr:hypothetical protein [Spongiibacter sp. UBA1325]|tara:strand:- start:4063 stop:4977 length:915 start_codon:yes stop_codon:yes gene_type:complete